MSSDEPPRGGYEPSTGLRIALGALALVVLAYSVLVATRPLLGVFLVALLFAVYLVWRFLHLATRFVRAVERIADAVDRPRREREREV